MIIWKQWKRTKTVLGQIKSEKIYKICLLFGIIPIFVFING